MAESTKTFKVTASPHTIGKETNRRIMIDVLIALLPSFIAGIVFFGLNAVYTVLVCMVLCYASEQLFNLCLKKPITTDLSCLVTGMILGLILPPKTPWYIPVVGSVFAIIFIKMLFGGVGKNIANPAATARVFLLLAFSVSMGSYLLPNASDFVHIDSTTGPTYLGGGYTALDATFMGVSGYWGYILQLFFGHVGGSIGETSVLAIVIGCAYLMVRKVIDWRIPISYIVSSALMTLICYQTAYDVLPQLFSGGLMFGAVFMATDYATCPKYKHNRVLFGIFIGFMTILLRKYSNYPESVSFAIILANLFVPIMDRFILPLRFGQTNKKGKVRVDVYGFSMQWIVPVFLVIIIILTSVFAVVRPYTERYYSKYASAYFVADNAILDAKTQANLAEKGDYLFEVKGSVPYTDADNIEQLQSLGNYLVVLYTENTRSTATIKVRNIIERQYMFASGGNVPALNYVDVNTAIYQDEATKTEITTNIGISDTFKEKTLQQVKDLNAEALTVQAANDTKEAQAEARKYTAVKTALKNVTIDIFDYYNFIQQYKVEQFTYQAQVRAYYATGEEQTAENADKVIDGVVCATQRNFYSITLRKAGSGKWIVESIVNYVQTNPGWTADYELFIGKTKSQIEKLKFEGAVTDNAKKIEAMNNALKQEILTAFATQENSTQIAQPVQPDQPAQPEQPSETIQPLELNQPEQTQSVRKKILSLDINRLDKKALYTNITDTMRIVDTKTAINFSDLNVQGQFEEKNVQELGGVICKKTI